MNEIEPSRPAVVCERCGAPLAEQIGDHWLCTDCCAVAGACCPEFGADDLWQTRPDTTVNTLSNDRPGGSRGAPD
jgi:hypothetical protein